MNLSRSQLAKLISNQTFNKGITKSISNDVAKILLSSNKTGSLSSLMRDVEYNWSKLGYLDVIVRSAFSLSVQTKKDIKKLVAENYPSVNQVTIIEQLDPSVIAGIILELPDKQLNLSVANKINQFKNFAVLNKRG